MWFGKAGEGCILSCFILTLSYFQKFRGFLSRLSPTFAVVREREREREQERERERGTYTKYTAVEWTPHAPHTNSDTARRRCCCRRPLWTDRQPLLLLLLFNVATAAAADCILSRTKVAISPTSHNNNNNNTNNLQIVCPSHKRDKHNWWGAGCCYSWWLLD